MNEEEIKKIAKELMIKAQPAYLATLDENGFPQIRAVENVRNPEKFPHDAKTLLEYDDDIIPYISTNTSSEKIKQILENNSAAMYFCSPDEYKGIMLQGDIEIVNDLDLKKRIWQDSMLRYYPKGHTDPDFTILRLIPKYMKTWYKGKKGELKISE
ncbi:MAG: pyridoxamine 5'-phosphate oxidase family protein [Candidatus Heimdallarchaeota archaeon]|nr:pyridoxamine 5'-phosphate oxidase family protein [Candidatus Heimdallarchaeota archaeon]MBY8994475.1 pyridoxamine 5'-phosphate oxidase family protein [Candidatus Heimdallarchaeota archaeon]